MCWCALLAMYFVHTHVPASVCAFVPFQTRSVRVWLLRNNNTREHTPGVQGRGAQARQCAGGWWPHDSQRGGAGTYAWAGFLLLRVSS